MKWVMVLFLFLCGCDREREAAKKAKAVDELPRWEYFTLMMDYVDSTKQDRRMNQGLANAPGKALVYFINGVRCQGFATALHCMGKDGWEFVGLVPFESGTDLVFKRAAGKWPDTKVDYKELTRFDK